MVRLCLAFFVWAYAVQASAFCGFYVGKADAKLFNDASQVIMARDGDRTTITMLNDYQGDLREFAMVVPVPEVLKRESIKIADNKIFERIGAYTAPRLAEYFDPDPCARRELGALRRQPMAASAPMQEQRGRVDKALGVTVEATYTVGEYDIVILSANESSGLETWLRQNQYRIPAGAAAALAPYIKQKLKFFVARVNLKEQARTGAEFLRPLQFTFRYERFGLPIRLGMINARGPQDLVLYVLSKEGRVETTNYRTVKLPANMDVPTYLRGEFGPFYKALFDEHARRESYRAVFTEYFWDMSWCDPCAAEPFSRDELLAAGVTWVGAAAGDLAPGPATSPAPSPGIMPRRAPQSQPGAQPVMVTRLHIRYTPQTFPEDLMFQETKDRANYQTRYVLRHPWAGDPNACPDAAPYFDGVRVRRDREAEVAASLTGWRIETIRARMAGYVPGTAPVGVSR